MLLALMNDESKSINARLDIVEGQYKRILSGGFDFEMKGVVMISKRQSEK